MSKHVKETAPLLKFEKGEGFDLWREHSTALKSWDDLSLARWLNQTLGQLHEHCWRASHPLVVAYRMGATVAYQRDLWNRRTFSYNPHYTPTPCCGAPSIPFVSFEIATHGAYCSCCGEVLAEINDLPAEINEALFCWSQKYDPLHQVAHWTDEERKIRGDYNKALDRACQHAAPLLARLGYELAPKLLGIYPAIFWDDADNCLDLIPEEVTPLEE